MNVPSSLVSLHACRGASLTSLYRADLRDHEPPQLSWAGETTGLVTLSVGWNDSSLPAAIARCGRAPSHCRARWGSRFAAAISGLGSSARDPRSLRHLFQSLAAAAPNARVIVLGYPRPFAAPSGSACRIGSGALALTRAAIGWIDAQVARLDRTIQAAASTAHVTYLRGSESAFAGHELCTRHPYLDDSLHPTRHGQMALAVLLARALSP